MSANVDAMVRAGAEAYRNGNKADARTLLEKAIELDQYNEQAWLWLSAVVGTPEEQRTCLENVLVINPKNERALMGLRSLGIDPGVASKKPDAPPQNQPAFSGMDQSASAFEFDVTDDLFGDNDTDDQDIIATSSASANYDTSYDKNEYDDWMNNLNIGQSTPASTPTSGGDAFGGDAFGDDAFGGDAFGDEAFGDEAFGDDAFGDEAFGDDAFGDEAFGDDGFSDDAYAPNAFESDAFTSGGGGAFTDDIATADDVSVGFDASFAEGLVDEDEFDSFESAMQEEIFSDDSLFANEGDFYIPDDDDLDGSDDDEDYFAYIPKEIDMTRLPGEDEDRPIALIAVALVLLVMNLGAVGMLVMRLSA